MGRKSIQEYAVAVRARYLRGTKAERGVILDEFCQTTGYRRKSAIRLIRGQPRGSGKRRGRQRTYGTAVVEALKTLWEAGDRMCSKRLVPFLPELLTVLEREGEIRVTAEVRSQLLRLSPATVDRLLAAERQGGRRRPRTQSSATPTLRSLVPVRTFGEWAEVSPGSLQADLVAHCGESTEGFYLTTLVAVDVATGWTECQAVLGKTQQRVGGAVHDLRRRLPFALRELHTDNGGEFLNELLYPYCQRTGVRFTRGRPYRKNDQAYVEQKNWSVVRRLVGYDRYTTPAAHQQLGWLYEWVRPYVNFFQPVRKLVSKERVGAKVRKRYDTAQTPYQRLLASGVLDEAQREALAEQYRRLNPVRLRTTIERALEELWRLAEREPTGTKAASGEPGGPPHGLQDARTVLGAVKGKMNAARP